MHLDLADPVALLEAAGYRITLGWSEESPYVTPGSVAVQDPAGGTAMGPGATVALLVGGPEPGTVVPEVLGRHYLDAAARLEGSGHLVDVVEMYDPSPDHDTASNLLWGQFPSGGEPTTGRAIVCAALGGLPATRTAPGSSASCRRAARGCAPRRGRRCRPLPPRPGSARC